MIKMVVSGVGRGTNQRLHHCDVIRKTQGLSLYGICEPENSCREEVCRYYEVREFSSIEDVLADNRVDAVAIATPNDTHADLAVRCLEAGKHVVLEKPMCLSTSEADAIIQASRRSGCILTVRHNRRWDGDFLTVKRVIEEGQIGRVLVLDSALNALIRPSGWRIQKSMGGGWFVDWGCHLIDQVLQLVPSRPVSVFAAIASFGWEVEVETYARVILRFENGTISEVETSNVSWLPRPRWYVLGDKGSLIFREGAFRLRNAFVEEDISPCKSSDHEFYANFSECLNDGKELAVKPEQVRQVIAVIEAAFHSAETGQVVRL